MLRIHENAVRLVRDCVLIAHQIEKADGDLAKQLKRAIVSVPLNIAEGSDQVGRRRKNHYRYALGSAREAQSALVVAQAAGYVGEIPSATHSDSRAVIGVLNCCIYR